jgi:hypothetical protein
MSEHCRDCKHWHENPPAEPGPILRKEKPPVTGECREHLHAVPVNMGGVTGWITGYPSVPDTFVACGRFAGRVACNGTPEGSFPKGEGDAE